MRQATGEGLQDKPLVARLYNSDRDFASLIEGLLQFDPERRLSPVEALRHPFCSRSFPFLEFFSTDINRGAASVRRTEISPRKILLGGDLDPDASPILRKILGMEPILFCLI